MSVRTEAWECKDGRLGGSVPEQECVCKVTNIQKGVRGVMNLPQDPIMLLSYVNTQLRDHYASLDELCASLGLDRAQLEEKLGSVDYAYDASLNAFV